MNSVERRRLVVFSKVAEGELSVSLASKLLKISYRHAKRLWRRYQAEGDAGLVHRGRGRPSNRKPNAELKERVLALYRKKYSDYGPTLAAEVLAEEDGVVVATSTLRRWLIKAGLWSRQRKSKQHRRRRIGARTWASWCSLTALITIGSRGAAPASMRRKRSPVGPF
jgi:transposase